MRCWKGQRQGRVNEKKGKDGWMSGKENEVEEKEERKEWR